MATVASKSPLVNHLDNFYNTGDGSAANRGLPASSSWTEERQESDQQQYSEPSSSRHRDAGSNASRTTPSNNMDKSPDAAPIALEDEFPEPICGGCRKLIDEDSADAGVIHFATQLWHVDCFRCAKCHNLVTTDCDDILLLSDGNPICGQCNYSCQICGLPIMEEAIMTGDESYHSACFTCRSCHLPISELVFAKTSQGIYCMNCHNQRVARSRRHADRKKSGSSSSRSKRPDGSKGLSPAKTGVDSPSTSPSIDMSSLQASESDMSTLKTTEESASASPLLNQRTKTGAANSSGSIGKRPLNPPPTSLREIRESYNIDRTVDREPRRSSSENRLEPAHRGATHSPRSIASEQDALSKDDVSVQSTAVTSAAPTVLPAASITAAAAASPHSTNARLLTESPALPDKDKLVLPTVVQPQKARGGGGDGDDDLSALSQVQYKRASRMSVFGGATSREDSAPRMSKSFSFYDPEMVSLMESITRFESADEGSSDLPLMKGHLAGKALEDDAKAVETIDAEAAVREVVADEPELKQNDSTRSLQELSSKMRETMKTARDGHVSMDTNFVEGILEELDATRGKMRTLQKKYERIRRASQQAAQGFSSAREEYEQELQARYEAEAEMLSLKKQLNLQAARLAELTTEKKQQESLQRQSRDMKSSLQGMERDLAKLTVERDLTVAEVAELVSMQDGRKLPTTTSGNEEVLKRGLTLRLDSVKDRYRGDLRDLQAERDALMTEIEELKRSRDVVSEQTQSLIRRNEELTASIAHLTRRLEHAQAQAAGGEGYAPTSSQDSRQQRSTRANTDHKGAGSNTPASGFGFGFSRQNRQGSVGNPSASTAVDSAISNEASDNSARSGSGVGASLGAVTRADAMPRMFKWKKTPKLTVDNSRGSGNAHLSPGATSTHAVSPPVPPKSGQQTSPYLPNVSLQQQQQQPQQQQQQAQSLSQHTPSSSQMQHSGDQALASNGHSNGYTNGEVVVKEHLFQPFSILRPTRCFACQKNMWGQSEMKCSLCSQLCHTRCLASLPTSCNQPFTRPEEAGVEYTGPSMFGRALVEQVQSEGADRKSPLVVEKCIQAVENLGMDYEGIYRKSGGTSQLKIITQLFENRQPFNLEDRDRFNDISAVTSVLKNYFRELPEPLLTFDLHERFIQCVESKADANQKEEEMRELVHSLPREHFETLRLLIDHLHRVHGRGDENRMNSRSLGVVFGPTLMRSGDFTQEFAHMGGKAMTIEFMIDNPQLFD